MQQLATDFLDECQALYDLMSSLTDADFDRPTLFKDWTLNHVLQHLHFFDRAAGVSLDDGNAFDRLWAGVQEARAAGEAPLDVTDRLLDHVRGHALLEAWKRECHRLSAQFAEADPKMRVKWAGPEMSARSKATARLMETWAHGQEIYDLLGVRRINTDRIKNIAIMGVKTFGWTFINRGEQVPEHIPHVRLSAPSGEIWEWNEASDSIRVEGSAEGFCQVVTQVRNVADTDITTTGETAAKWMAVAQCFAGDAQMPPAPGTRFSAAL
ncbi:MAG: TIGR03084 family protein [Rhodospirillaceae bacterium]|nr:TIGR03084 family protein [Rhodospirillaceae bacterium]